MALVLLAAIGAASAGASTTGDTKADVIAQNPLNGEWGVAGSTGSSFTTSLWRTGWGIGTFSMLTGDYNGDGHADALTQLQSNGSWEVGLSTGSSFATPTRWFTGWATGTYKLLSGDYNGDGKDDALVQVPSNGLWEVGLSTGSSFAAPTHWFTGWGIGGSYSLLSGDFNGDGRDDALLQIPSNGNWEVGLSTGSSFAAPTTWQKSWAAGTHYRLLAGDWNGDGKDDILAQNPLNGDWGVALSNGGGFYFPNPASWMYPWAAGTQYKLLAGDWNGDGKDDILAQNPNNGDWGVALSNGNGFSFPNPASWLYPWAAGEHYKLATLDPPRWLTSISYGGSNYAIDNETELNNIITVFTNAARNNNESPATRYGGMSPDDREYLKNMLKSSYSNEKAYQEWGSSTIYWMMDGYRYSFASYEVAEAAGYPYSNIKVLPTGTLSSVPGGGTITMANLNEPEDGIEPAGSVYKLKDEDEVSFYSEDKKALAAGWIKWWYGSNGKGYIHKGTFAPGSAVFSNDPNGPNEAPGRSNCIWASVTWHYLAITGGSISLPPAISGSFAGQEVDSGMFVSCKRSGQDRPDPLSLVGLSYTKTFLTSATVKICTSTNKSEGPRFCSPHPYKYGD